MFWKLPLLRNYSAITLPWGIYYNPNAVISESLKRHEECHVQQIKKLGVMYFYTSYVFYYLKNLLKYRNHDKAYSQIPYEIEAGKAE